MSVKIRLQRHGSKKRPFYFIVAANSVAPRDGKFIEKLGTYNPLTIPATITLDRDRSVYWMDEGAEPTNTCRRILSFKGVLYLRHLKRGVKLGLFGEQEAMDKFEKWNIEHEEIVNKRQEAHRIHKQEKRHAISTESVKKVEEKIAAKAAEVKAASEAASEEAAETEVATPDAVAPEGNTEEAAN